MAFGKQVGKGADAAPDRAFEELVAMRGGRRSGRDLIFYLLFPLLGFLIIFYVWFNFDAGTFLFGVLWLGRVSS